MELNIEPLIVAACNWPAELCVTEETTRIEDAWREAARLQLRRELDRVEAAILGVEDVQHDQ